MYSNFDLSRQPRRAVRKPTDTPAVVDESVILFLRRCCGIVRVYKIFVFFFFNIVQLTIIIIIIYIYINNYYTVCIRGSIIKIYVPNAYIVLYKKKKIYIYGDCDKKQVNNSTIKYIVTGNQIGGRRRLERKHFQKIIPPSWRRLLETIDTEPTRNGDKVDF